MIKIAPSILTADLVDLRKEIKFLEVGEADFIHIDVMDGSFVPNISFGMPLVRAIKKHTTIPLDVHLMIVNPEKHTQEFIEAGASYLTIHQEATIHLHRNLTQIKKLGAKAAVSINPSTPLQSIEEVIEVCDMVLIMSVNPGFGGQTFIESSLNKIERLKEMILKKGYKTLIEVDGGINLDNAKKVIEAGADILVVGNAIFSSSDIPKTINRFRLVGNS
jgi:ribulose-phosphate 3-epimerase